MSKIICELCGTSYSENAAQCPICGCAHPVDTQNIVSGDEQNATESTYQYVRGGRFSKANVRKRNNNKQKTEPVKTKSKNDIQEPEKKTSNKGLIITIFVLLLAIIAVVVYNALMFFGPVIPSNDAEDQTQPSVSVLQQPTEIHCTEISLEFTEIVLEQLGDTIILNATVLPVDTTDTCTFFTADDTVATVNAEGVITAVGSGETDITVTCGSISAVCKVVVSEPVEPFALMYDQLLFEEPGAEALLYVGSLPMDEIVWASDDEAVATVADGLVTAIEKGVTTIYGSYNGETLACTVVCEFEGKFESEVETTEATFVDNGPYKLKNRYGFSDTDATIRIGESFTLILIDKNGDTVTNGVTWSVIDGDCCSVEDGIVKGVSSGQAKVVATFHGESYSCLVRVS